MAPPQPRRRSSVVFLLIFASVLSRAWAQERTLAPIGTTPAGYAVWRTYANSDSRSKWVNANHTIGLGDFVLWEWSGGIHNVKGVGSTGEYPQLCGVENVAPTGFYSGLPEPRGSFTFQFFTPGTYYYICEPHCYEVMWGAITVLDKTTYEIPTTVPPATNETEITPSPTESASPTPTQMLTASPTPRTNTLPPAPSLSPTTWTTTGLNYESFAELLHPFFDDTWYLLLGVALLQ